MFPYIICPLLHLLFYSKAHLIILHILSFKLPRNFPWCSPSWFVLSVYACKSFLPFLFLFGGQHFLSSSFLFLVYFSCLLVVDSRKKSGGIKRLMKERNSSTFQLFWYGEGGFECIFAFICFLFLVFEEGQWVFFMWPFPPPLYECVCGCFPVRWIVLFVKLLCIACLALLFWRSF